MAIPAIGGFLITLGAAFGYAAGWNPYASDYTRYLPADDRARPVAGRRPRRLRLLQLLEIAGAAGRHRRPAEALDPDARSPTCCRAGSAKLTLLAVASAPSPRTCSTSTPARCRSWRWASGSAPPPRAAIVAVVFGHRRPASSPTSASTSRPELRGLPADHRLLDRTVARRRARRPAAAPRHDDGRPPSPSTTHLNWAGPIAMASASSSRSGCSPTRRNYTGPVPTRSPGRRRHHLRRRLRHRRGRLRGPRPGRSSRTLRRDRRDRDSSTLETTTRRWLAVASRRREAGLAEGGIPIGGAPLRDATARCSAAATTAASRTTTRRCTARPTRSATPGGSVPTAARRWSPRCRPAGTAAGSCGSSASAGSWSGEAADVLRRSRLARRERRRGRAARRRGVRAMMTDFIADRPDPVERGHRGRCRWGVMGVAVRSSTFGPWFERLGSRRRGGAAQVDAALQDVGFFLVTGHGVPRGRPPAGRDRPRVLRPTGRNQAEVRGHRRGRGLAAAGRRGERLCRGHRDPARPEGVVSPSGRTARRRRAGRVLVPATTSGRARYPRSSRSSPTTWRGCGRWPTSSCGSAPPRSACPADFFTRHTDHSTSHHQHQLVPADARTSAQPAPRASSGSARTPTSAR